MAEIEKSLPIFRGGNDRFVRPDDLFSLLADILDLRFYKKLQLHPSSQSVDSIYTTDEAFWKEAFRGQHYESKRVRLQGFHLTEWLPSAPGRYFTPEAELSRLRAEKYLAYGGQEYLPLGKESMVLGGVGSVRLSAKLIDSNTTYFLGASSTGISHQGVPVALHEPDFRQVIQIIRGHGGCLANLTGTLQTLPASISPIQYDRKIPKYCLFLTDLEIIRPSSKTELIITIAITFSNGRGEQFSKGGYTTTSDKSWAFCSFYPGKLNQNLDGAVNWLKDYALQYSNHLSPPILADFDEHYQHFTNPIEFRLKDVSNDVIDIERIEAYLHFYGVR